MLHNHLLYPISKQLAANHYNDVIMGAMASQITSLTIAYSAVYSGADQRKHQSSASLAFVRRIHRWPVNSPHKGPVMLKMLPFDDVIMLTWRTIIRIITWWRTTSTHLNQLRLLLSKKGKMLTINASIRERNIHRRLFLLNGLTMHAAWLELVYSIIFP